VAPALPPNAGGSVQPGAPVTVYAHVGNLGRAPVVGARVEFSRFDRTFAFDDAHANLICTDDRRDAADPHASHERRDRRPGPLPTGAGQPQVPASEPVARMLEFPPKGQANVLRLFSYDGDQHVGGYTIVAVG
jgi:hypothetical protein